MSDVTRTKEESRFLQYVVNNDVEHVAEMLAETPTLAGLSFQRFDDPMTVFEYACKHTFYVIAHLLLKTGHANPGNINTITKKTPIFDLVTKKNANALTKELIESGQSNSEQVCANSTALMQSIFYRNYEISIALIDSGKSNPGFTLSDKRQALMYLVDDIRGYYNDEHNTRILIILECLKKLLNTDQSIYGYGYEYVTKLAAKNQQMRPILQIFEDYNSKPRTIDVNLHGIDYVSGEEHRIRDYVAEDRDNIVFQIAGQNMCFLSNRDVLRSRFQDAIKYECYRASNQSDGMLDSNINIHEPLISMRKLGIMVDYIFAADMAQILYRGYINYYILVPYKILASTISKGVYDGTTGGMSDSHCQEGQGGILYKCFEQDPSPESMAAAAAVATTQAHIPEIVTTANDDVDENGVKYQEFVRANVLDHFYTFRAALTPNQIKDRIILYSRDLNVSKVRLFYRGREITGDQPVSSLPNYEPNMSFITMLQYSAPPNVGGSRHRRHKKIKKRKTKRRTGRKGRKRQSTRKK